MNMQENQNPTISVVIPVYNVEAYLRECVDSVLNQTMEDFEIILVDDGATDSSGRICDEYACKDARIRVIHKENEGLLMTRRRGFREARGDWFICVDSDDYVAPDLLARVVNAIRETDADMVMYNFEYYNAQGVHTPSRLKLNDGEVFEGEGKQWIYEKRLLSVDINSLCIRAVRRNILDFDTDYSTCGVRNMGDDALQVLPIYTASQKIVYLDTPLYFYRKWSGSTTGRYSMDRWESAIACFYHTEEYMRLWNVSNEVEARFYTKHLEFLCNYVRWLFSAEKDELPATLPEMVAQLKNAPDYIVSRQNYRKEFAHSRYLSMLVPILTRFVESGNIPGIRLVLGLEKQLLKFKK